MFAHCSHRRVFFWKPRWNITVDMCTVSTGEKRCDIFTFYFIFIIFKDSHCRLWNDFWKFTNRRRSRKNNKIHSQMTFIPWSGYDTYSGWESTITLLGRLMPITAFHCENRLPTNWHTRLLLLPRDLIVKCYYKHNLCSTCIRQLI